jgi:UDP-3-O-[3-hydroxymyristoyl] glucosamine N-acyltransferase LpxD
MLITTIVGNVTHLDVFGDITDFYGEEITPELISYSDNTINVGGFVMRVENGRYAFRQALNCFEEPKMEEVSGFNMVCQNTVISGDITIGYHNTIGKYGFGYERKDGKPYRIKHLGNVIIGKEVEIGSNVCIDRGTVGPTVIGDYTKIDNQIHIAHNVKIGKCNLLAAGCIIEGSVHIGDNNTFGTGVIALRKVRIGNNCILGSGCVITKDVPDNSVMVGNPARLLKTL